LTCRFHYYFSLRSVLIAQSLEKGLDHMRRPEFRRHLKIFLLVSVGKFRVEPARFLDFEVNFTLKRLKAQLRSAASITVIVLKPPRRDF
jgi:hypothetical protein